MLILVLQLFIRFYIKEDVKVHWLSPNLNIYLNRLIILNKKVNLIYIWLAIIIILVGLFFSIYLVTYCIII
jgi:hypothetical protein